jgi:outer membrane protein TolC
MLSAKQLLGISLFFVISLGVSLTTQAQNTTQPVLNLSLEEALNRAAEDGYEVQISKREMEMAKAQFTQGNAAFLPQISIEEMAVKTNDPIGVFGIKLRQGIITNSDFNPATLNDPDSRHNYTTRFQLNQPVFNADAFLQRSAAKYQYQSAVNQQKAVEEYTSLKIKEMYYQLGILDEQVKVLNSHLEMVKAFEKQAADYLEQGMINRAEYLNAKVEILNLEKELLAANNARQSVNDQFLIMLGINDEYLIEVTEEINIERFKSYSDVSFSGDNSTLKAYQNQVKASEKMLKSSQFSFIPKLNVFGSYEFHDTSVFGTQADNYTIGASLKWELFKGMKNVGKVAQNKAQFKKAELVYEQKRIQYQADIRTAKRSIGEAIQILELTDASLEQSAEDVRIRSDRYKQGLEKTTDLLKAESNLLTAELQRLQSTFKYYMAVAQLEFLLETDL